MAVTKRANLIDPQVIADYLDVKLIDAIKLSPLVAVDNTLVGRAGSKLTLPKYVYTGMAEDVAEGVEVVPKALSESTVEVQVKKAMKAIEITDEAKLSAYGDPIARIGEELLVGMADKIEDDLFVEMRKATTEVTVQAFDKYAVVDMQVKFGEDLDGEMFLFINPQDFAVLRKDPDFVYIANGAGIISGERGMIFGARVVVSNRVKAKEAFLMKRGALALIMKRNCMVEADRNILAGIDTYACNEHFVAYLKYDDKVVKLKIGA